MKVRVPNRLRELGSAAVDLLYPPACAGCGRRIPGDELLCGDCEESTPVLEPPFCDVCSQPFSGALDSGFRCPNCADLEFDFEHAVAFCRSRGLAREMIHRFKYNGEYHLRIPLGAWLVRTLSDPRLAEVSFDAVVPVPLHSVRQREREYNQAEELAAAAARVLHVPVLRALKRVRPTETQTHFDRQQRMENLRNAFAPVKNTSVNDLSLLLVDDVFTTGSTVQECARVLRSAGARRILVAAVARG